MQTVTRLGKLVFTHKSLLFGGIFFMMTYSLFTVAPAKYMKDVVDSLNSGEVPELKKFILVGLATFGLFLFKDISFFFQSYLMGALGQRLIRDLREQLFRKITSLSFSFFSKRQTGDIISRFTTDISILEQAVNICITGPLRDLPQILLLLGLMYFRSWQLFLVTLLLIPPAALLIGKFGKKNKKVTTQRQSKYGDLTALLNESISGIRVVQAFNMEKHETNKFKRENTRLFRYILSSLKITAYSSPILELIGASFGALILTYGGYLIIHGHITGGDFASFLMAFFMINDPIKKFNGFVLKLQEGLSAANRIYEIIDSKNEIVDKENAMVLQTIKKDIHIKIDRFAYLEQMVLRNIDLKVPAGSIVAFVGSSGSGKTTLINLIPRFYDIAPENGFIKIDGHKLTDVTLSSLRKQIAIVTQEIVLFNDTVANNIAYGDINCSREQIVQAAKMAYADNFIDKLPSGYDQQIGEKGVTLSGGQRQRLSIARALIKDAPILILDEATSALDNESEKEVQGAIENLMKNRTTFVIAHRFSTIQHADVICVLKGGEIIEKGSHKELYLKKGEYKRLYDLQFSENNTVFNSLKRRKQASMARQELKNNRAAFDGGVI